MMTVTIAVVVNGYCNSLSAGYHSEHLCISPHFRNEEKIILVPTSKMRKLRLTEVPCRSYTAVGKWQSWGLNSSLFDSRVFKP